jgi:transcriptional regulator with XRE-family HTH domain
MATRRHRLAQRRKAVGYTQEQLAEQLGVERTTVARWEAGETEPQPWHRPNLADALRVSVEELAALLTRAAGAIPSSRADDEQDALELARRVAASDVGAETLQRLERAVDDLATRYSVTPPAELLPRVRQHVSYVAELLDSTVRKTLGEHRQLLVTGAWLSLLAATLQIDLNQRAAGDARLSTAASLARQAEQDEIHAWCYETRAWDALTGGDYGRALDLSRTAQHIAPAGSSALIQATAQEGRAWARLGRKRETTDTLHRVNSMVSTLARPDRPEHHYRYDPDKSLAYTATTLAWIGDPAAEGYAREVIDRLRAAEDGGGWPRRVAAAQLDLALALIAADKPDEAAASARTAMLSGRVVPSNYWRAAEVVRAVEAGGVPAAHDLRDVFETMRRVGRRRDG